MSIVFAYITTSGPSEAKKIGKQLLTLRLAACVNIIDRMNSLYWWKGKIEEGKESILIAKTTRKLYPKLEKKVKELHSYECPCVLELKVERGSKEYLQWLNGSLRP